MSEQMLSINEAARRLGVSPLTLRSRIYRRELPYTKVFRSVRIAESTVADILNRGSVPALNRERVHSAA